MGYLEIVVFHCINPNNFYEDVYPLLVKVRHRGIEVICIGGDIGAKANEFEYITSDTIYFLASGISYQKTRQPSVDILSQCRKPNTKLDIQLYR